MEKEVQAKLRKQEYIDRLRWYFTLLFFSAPLGAEFCINSTPRCLRKLQQSKDKRISSTPSTCQRLTLLRYRASSEKRHIKRINGSFALNLKTSHKVTGHPWNLDVFKCTWKYHCHPKSLTFHWNQSLFLLTCTEVSSPRVTTRWQHKLTVGTQTLLLASHKGSFAFLPERGP